MKSQTIKNIKYNLPWLLFAFVTLFCLIYWLITIKLSLSTLTISNIFPILGIYAWSLMWTHYIISANRILNEDIPKNYTYSKVSGTLVLAFILLHPTLLAWQQLSLTSTLPPESFYNYVGESLEIFILMGSISLLIFLSFDILKRFKKNPIIKKYWKIVSLLQIIAMILIFIHGLSLGSLLNSKLFEFYWILLGVTLLPCFGLIIKNEWQDKK